VAVDLTGGLPDDREYVFASKPDDPEMRESVNAWIWDSGTEFGMPRIAIEAVGDNWDTHDNQVNISFADGRVFNIFAPGKVHDPIGADGKSRILGAGPLSFELVEPFKHWRMHLDGLAVESTVEAQIGGGRANGEGDVPVEIDLDIVAVLPPWENGALLPEAKRVLEEQDEGALMGGPRFEQLSRATGSLRVGDRQHGVDGGALRVRRQGVRRMGTFRGHAWQSSVFPSGRAFGYIVYPEREDGLPTYNEGYLFDGDGELMPAWVVDAPWLRRLQPRGEDVSVVMESAKGTTRIQAESVVSCFSVMGGIGPGTEGFPILQQAIARFTLDGETANGMMERSIPANKLEK
jgi:prepilin-type processing-associated H-X9-DG protein